MSYDPQPIVFKISKTVRSSRHHFHLRMEPLSNAIALAKPPHGDDRFEPGSQCFCQLVERTNTESLYQFQKTRQLTLRCFSVQRFEQQKADEFLFSLVQRVEHRVFA